MSPPRPRRRFSDEDYRAILEFRTRLRRFLAWSGAQARQAGLTPAQHQLLLAVRGHPDAQGPTIGDLAAYLQLRHHSVVGLVDRAEAAGLVRRCDDAHDRRVARVQLQPEGEAALEHLTALHVAELRALAEGLSLSDFPGPAQSTMTGGADLATDDGRREGDPRRNQGRRNQGRRNQGRSDGSPR